MSLQRRFNVVRQQSLKICRPLEIEDYVVQSIAEVSPPKWHLAHITWFWEEFILSKYLRQYKSYHPQYSYLFNSYYDAVGTRVARPDRGRMSRPTVKEVLNYRKYVDSEMNRLLESREVDHDATLQNLIELGLHHEQQHQELLLTDIKYLLGHNPLFPVYRSDFEEMQSYETDHSFTTVESSIYGIGFQGSGFSFDNELNRHDVFLQSFSIRNSLVTNGEFLDFINDGGYDNPQWWHSDGWSWLRENEIDSPLYWNKVDGAWMRYSLSGLEKVNPLEPVTHISLFEALAFAESRGMRLPTEFEWEASCDHFKWGSRWEHTNSAYLPYPGFQRPDGAIGEYNGKFMINQMVLRGASIATPRNHSRRSYRNFFQPHLRWQFNGIRLCKK